MKNKKRRNNIKYSKSLIIASLFLVGVMIIRLVQLSTAKEIDGTNLQKLANSRTTKTIKLEANRGTIYSANKDVLAQNVTSYKLIAYLDSKRTTNKKKPQHVVDKDLTAEKLAPILGMEKQEILKYLNKENLYQTEFGNKGKGLTEIQKNDIDNLNLPGLDFIESYKRYYPKGNFLSYTLGYATPDEDKNGDTVINGKMGLEQYYNNILKGEDGYVTYQKDLKGYKISGTNEIRKDAVQGKDIYLTIDSNVQFFIEQALTNAKNNYGYEWFTIVILDAKTGKVLGLSSNPNFDLNTRNDIESYLDLTISVPYEPGSTMKTYTYMAAMENNVYNGEATYKSGTYVTSDGTEIGDWNRAGWGYITFDRGYALSSNVGVINLIQNNMNSTMLRQYYKRLGFGKKTGITLPNEQTGKINFKYETEILNAGFGQGITTTPMQNAQAMTPLTNDGILLKPYIVDKIVDHDTGEVVFSGARKEKERLASTQTVEKMLKLMDDTVNGVGNTGSLYRLESGELIGKTGTAQIAGPNGRGYLNGKADMISSFSGVYPKSNPQFIIYASVKRPSNGNQRTISTAVLEIISNISKYYGTEVTESEGEKITSYKMPTFKNKSLENVQKTLKDNNINNVVVIGSGNKVINQYPVKNTTIVNKDRVFLLTNDNNIKVPDVKGYSSKEAKELLKLCGIKAELAGNGYVVSQSIEPGVDVVANMKINLELSPKFDAEVSS